MRALKPIDLAAEGRFSNAVLTFINRKFNHGVNNLNFKCKYIDVYLRHGHRLVDGNRVTTLEIGRVDVPEKYRGRGVFKQLVAIIHGCSKHNYYMYIENVLNERLAASKMLSTWTLVPPTNATTRETPCFIHEPSTYIDSGLITKIKKHEPRRPEVMPVRTVSVNMHPDTFKQLSNAARIAGFSSVEKYMLSAVKADQVDGDGARALYGHACRQVRFSDIRSVFTFRQLFPAGAGWDQHNHETHVAAEKIFLANAWTLRLAHVQKHPNKFKLIEE